MEYIIYAQSNPATTAEQIVIDITIVRDGELSTSWVARFPSTMSDSAIRIDLIRRIQEYIKVDSGQIASAQTADRASAIADSIDEHMEITP
jgi:hypothetical protein